MCADVTASNNGTAISAALPNIMGSTYLIEAHNAPIGLSSSAGCITGDDVGVITYPDGGADTAGTCSRRMIIDASRCSSIYGNSDTVQPPSICVNYYIQVYNAATELSTQNSDMLTSQMQMKADTNFANVTEPVQVFKTMTMNWSMPDYSAAVDITSELNKQDAQYNYCRFL